MSVSLVLATVGRTDQLRRCLDSLVAQDDQDFEVLVVDQNPDDRLVPLLRAYETSRFALRHLRMAVPSLSGARNLGIAAATGEIVGFPDDDCWYEPETIAAVQNAFDEGSTVDGVVACWVEQMLASGRGVPSGELSLHDWRNYRGGDASSISLFLKKSLLDKLGGFDQRLGVGRWFGAAEEIDLVLRALEDGAHLSHVGSARVHHAFGQQPTSISLQQCNAARRRARGTGAIYSKHRLSVWILVRGLFAPAIKPLMRLQFSKAVHGGFVGLGRLEGYLKWTFQES